MKIAISSDDQRYYRQDFTIDELDSFGNPNLQKLFKFVQDCISVQLRKLKVGPEDMLNHQCLYILCRIRIKFLRKVKPGERLTFITYPLMPTKIQMRREAFVNDSDGNVIALIDSLWVFINSKTRRITVTDYFKNDTSGFLTSLGNLKPVFDDYIFDIEYPEKGFVFCFDHVVTDKEIDLNGHMNNTFFDEIIQECSSCQILELNVGYEKECYLGERIHVFKYQENHLLYILGKKESNELVFKAKVNYQKKYVLGTNIL